MKENEYSRFEEFNTIKEYKHIGMETFNINEYNKRYQEYLKTKEMNINTQKPNRKFSKGMNADDIKKNTGNSESPVPNTTNALNHTLSTVTTTVTTGVVAVAATAALVTNIVIPPIVTIKDITYDTVNYNLVMENVDESLNYFVIIEKKDEATEGNPRQYVIEIPDDDNPDDNLIEYDGTQNNLEDNTEYNLIVKSVDFKEEEHHNQNQNPENLNNREEENKPEVKTLLTKDFKTKFQPIKFNFNSRIDELTGNFVIDYDVLIEKYKPSNNKTYNLVIKKGEEILYTDKDINDRRFKNSINISYEDYIKLIEDENQYISFEVYQIRKNKKYLAQSFKYGYKDFQPIVTLNTNPIIDENNENLIIEYNILLDKYMQSEDKQYRVDLKYKDDIINSEIFSYEIYNGRYAIPQEILSELINDQTNHIEFLIYEVRPNNETLIHSYNFTLADYKVRTEFNTGVSLTTNRDTLKLNYEVSLANIKPNSLNGYKVVIKYMNQIIDVNENYADDMFINEVEIPLHIMKEIVQGSVKEITYEVYETTRTTEQLISTHVEDLSPYFEQPTFNITEEFDKDINELNLNYAITLNGNLSLFKDYKVEALMGTERIPLESFVSGSSNGILLQVPEGEVRFVVTTKFMGEDIIIGEYVRNVIYPPTISLEVAPRLSQNSEFMDLRYFVMLEQSEVTPGRNYIVNLKYKNNVISSNTFTDIEYQGLFSIPTDIVKEMYNDTTNNITFEVYEEHDNNKLYLYDYNFNLQNYDLIISVLPNPSVSTDRSKVIMNYEVYVDNAKPSTISTYRLDIKYQGQIIHTNATLFEGMITNQFDMSTNLINNLLYGDFKTLDYEVYEITGNEEKLIESYVEDYSDYLKVPTFNITEEYLKDEVMMNLNYQIILNGNTSLFKDYQLEIIKGTEMVPGATLANRIFSGVAENVPEGEVNFVVKTMFMDEPIIIGSHIVNVTYPPVDLSTATLTFTPTFDKVNRSSVLTIKNTLNEIKPQDSYRMEVVNSNGEIVNKFNINNLTDTFTINNLKEATYNIKVIENKAGRDYICHEEVYNMVYPQDFFQNLVTANVEYTPTFDPTAKVTDLTIKPVIENKFPNNLYYITVNKGEYFTFTSPDFKVVENFTHTFNDLKPGIYNVKVFMKEVFKDSIVYEFDYNYEYPVGHLQSLLEPRCDVTESFDYQNKLSPLVVKPVIIDKFPDAQFRLIVSNTWGYSFTSELFKISDNFSHTIPNAKEGEQTFKLNIVLDGVETELSTETYMQSYPNDYDPLPDNNLATYNKVTSSDITIDATTKPGFLLISVPLNYHCDDTRYYYDIEVNEGMSTLGSITDCRDANPVIEVEDYALDTAYIYVNFKVREGYRYKSVETYSVQDNLMIGGPKVQIGEYKLRTDSEMAIPYTLTYREGFETVHSLTYTVLFNDGYKVNNTLNYDPNNKELIITGFSQNVTSMTINMTVNYDAPYGMGNRDKAIEEVAVTFPTVPVIKRAFVRAMSARLPSGPNIELDFGYFGEPGLTLVIEENGVELHRGGMSYQGPLENTATTYTYYLVDSGGQTVSGTTGSLNIDAASFPPYQINTLTADDVLITYNADGTYNYYLDLGFQVPQQTCYYVVTFTEYNNGVDTVYKEIKSRNSVFEAKNMPLDNYNITYQVYYEENGITYLYTNNEEIILSNQDIGSSIEYRFTHNTQPTLEITFYQGFSFDKTSVVINLDDGTVINLVESDFVLDPSGDLKVSKDVNTYGGEIRLMGGTNSKTYDAISAKTTIAGNRHKEIVITLRDVM